MTDRNIIPRCHVPWQQMVIDSTGQVSPCCYWGSYENRNPPVGDIRKQSIDDIWNGPAFRKLRASMAAGDLKTAGCEKCYAVQQGLHLNFEYDPDSEGDTKSLYAQNIQTLKAEIARGATVLEAKPTIVSYTPSHRCNIRCTHCYQEGTRDAEIDRAEADEEVARLAPYLVKLIAGGGEPFLLPIWRQFLTRFNLNTNQYLDFGTSTNATIVSDQILEGLSRFKKLTINVSLDGTGAAYDGVRVGAKFNQVAANIRRLKTVVQNAVSPASTIGVSMCVMKSNVKDLANFIRFCAKEELAFGMSPVTTMPPDESLRCFNDAASDMRGWREAFAAAELALEDYWPTYARLSRVNRVEEDHKEMRRGLTRMIRDAIPFELVDQPTLRVTLRLPGRYVAGASAKHPKAPLVAYIWRRGAEWEPAAFWGKLVDGQVEVSLPAGSYVIGVSTKWKPLSYFEGLPFEVQPDSTTIKIDAPLISPLKLSLLGKLTQPRVRSAVLRRVRHALSGTR